MKIFDYIFYRVCDFYKRKKDSSAEFTSNLIVSLIQTFTVIDLFIFIRIFWEYPMPKNFTKFWLLPIIIILPIINWYKYQKTKKYVDFRKIWKNEANQEKRKSGALIVLYLIISMLIPILYGLIRHNIMGGKSFWF